MIVFIVFFVMLTASVAVFYYLGNYLQSQGMSKGMTIAISVAAGLATYWVLYTFGIPAFARLLGMD